MGRILRIGFLRFTLQYGVLYWGVSTYVVWVALMLFTSGFHLLPRIGVALPFFLVGGAVWGASMWSWALWKSRRL
jgi:hypothetical protein